LSNAWASTLLTISNEGILILFGLQIYDFLVKIMSPSGKRGRTCT